MHTLYHIVQCKSINPLTFFISRNRMKLILKTMFCLFGLKCLWKQETIKRTSRGKLNFFKASRGKILKKIKKRHLKSKIKNNKKSI
jgi:hypothetical protein